MENIKGKITASKFNKEWENPKGGTLYFHDIEIDGEHKGQIGSKTKEPDFLNVGQEIEVSVTEGKYGNKFKRVTEQKQWGGGNSKKQTYEETQRMCKMSALKAAAEVNAKHGRVVIDEAGCNIIARFVLGDIRGDLANKWDDPKAKDMMCRQNALHCSATETEPLAISDANKLVEESEKKYKYIIG
jgi:hypothetical protein